MLDHLGFYFFLTIINFIFVKYFKKIKLFHTNMDIPDKRRKTHKFPVALAGGLIITFNLFFLLVYLFFFNIFEEKLIFILSCFLIFFMGFYDDKYNFSYNIKFFLLSLIFGFCYFFDQNFRVINLYSEIFDYEININKYSFFFTLLCFLLFSNALNMFDGINLQCITFSLITSFYLFLAGSSLELGTLIICLIFLYYSNHKNLLFLGNSGSYLLSFLISYQIIYLYNERLILSIEEIFIILMIPGIDMLRLFFQRIVKKRNPFKGDMWHIHHLLSKKYNYNIAICLITIILVLNSILLLIDFDKLIIIFLNIIIYFYLIFICRNIKIYL